MPGLPLDGKIRFGLTSRLPTRTIVKETTAMLERLEFDSVWVGDHIAFTSPILDPLLQLARAILELSVNKPERAEQLLWMAVVQRPNELEIQARLGRLLADSNSVDQFLTWNGNLPPDADRHPAA